MKIFVDFDDVLFNARDFKRDLNGVFYSHGIEDGVLRRSMYWGGKYDLEKQVDFLVKNTPVNENALRLSLSNFLMDLSKYIFKDVYDFLKVIKKNDIFIVSYGQAGWQKLKIENSGIGQYFRDIIVGSNKADNVMQLIEFNEDVKLDTNKFFLDDRALYLKDVKTVFPKIKTILVKRKEGRYDDEMGDWCDGIAKNMKGVLDILGIE